MIQQLINRYKRMRTDRYLNETYRCQYAFVGMGQHSLTNLYPVLHYLQVPLKYICVTSERKARLIERKFKGIKATTRLDDVLDDEDVKGVLVAASPSAHFSIASRVLQSGKSLFIEKPPCHSVDQLKALIAMQEASRSRIAMVGLQQRFQCGCEGRGIGVVSDKLGSSPFNAIDSPNGLGHGVQVVEMSDDGLFVGNGDIEAFEPFVAHPHFQPCERVALVGPILAIVNALPCEHRLEPLLRPGVSQRIANETIFNHVAKIQRIVEKSFFFCIFANSSSDPI